MGSLTKKTGRWGGMKSAQTLLTRHRALPTRRKNPLFKHIQMAGQKGRSGGARPGAGRPPQEPAVTGERDPMKFLEDVMSGVIEANVTQVKAAIAMLPFKYQKLGEGGKKEQKNDAAKKVANRFAPAAPPQLKAVK